MVFPADSCPLVFIQNVLWSTPDDVNDGEHDDPHRVDEMPIESQHMSAFRMFLFHRTRTREGHHDHQSNQAYDTMPCVQTDERIESCAKEIRLDCESFVVNQPIPFSPRSEQ